MAQMERHPRPNSLSSVRGSAARTVGAGTGVHGMSDEIDQARSRASRRVSAFAFVLLVLAVLAAALGITDAIGQQWSDIAKVGAVALFVGAMAALAMGMIGDA